MHIKMCNATFYLNRKTSPQKAFSATRTEPANLVNKFAQRRETRWTGPSVCNLRNQGIWRVQEISGRAGLMVPHKWQKKCLILLSDISLKSGGKHMFTEIRMQNALCISLLQSLSICYD